MYCIGPTSCNRSHRLCKKKLVQNLWSFHFPHFLFPTKSDSVISHLPPFCSPFGRRETSFFLLPPPRVMEQIKSPPKKEGEGGRPTHAQGPAVGPHIAKSHLITHGSMGRAREREREKRWGRAERGLPCFHCARLKMMEQFLFFPVMFFSSS